MKSFYIASAIMLIFLATAIPTSYYISGKLSSMYELAEKLPEALDSKSASDDTAKNVQKLTEDWNKNKKIFELTIPYYEIVRAEVEIHNISAFFQTGSDSAYRAARSRLLCALRELHDSESVSWESIL